MKLGNFRRTHTQNRERGYILLTLVLFCALMLIALAAQLPAMAKQARYDREQEMIHRGAQYARAIKRYYRKAGSYPVRMEQLQDTNHIRFLRRRYKDPMTGKDFQPLHYGEVKLGTSQLSGAVSASSLTTNSGFAAPSPSSSASNPSSSSTAGTTATSATAAANATSATTGLPMTAPSPSSNSAQPGGQGPLAGAGAIIGVASTSKEEGFHEFNKKTHFNDWAFVYDPTNDSGGLIKTPYNGRPAFTAVTAVGNPASTPSPAGTPQTPAGTPAGTGGGMGMGGMNPTKP